MSNQRPRTFERLETCRLLAVATVTNNSDDVNGDVSSIAALVSDDGGDGVSLREAIEAANATVGADEIDFDFGHDGPEAISLDGSPLRIASALTVLGPGADLLTIDGRGFSTVVVVGSPFSPFPSSVSVELERLTITGGSADLFESNLNGGGILNSADLTLRNVVLAENHAPGLGGGAANFGRLTIVDGSVTKNSSDSGGGIWNSQTLSLTNSIVSENTTRTKGGGIYNEGVLHALATTLLENRAGSGGGLFNAGESMIEESVLERNESGAGGGIWNEGAARVLTSTLLNNGANHGGGIANQQELFVGSSALTENWSSDGGGGIDNYGEATISNTTMSNNYGRTGGAAANLNSLDSRGAIAFIDATLTSNSAVAGGALYNAGDAEVFGSLISNNEAASSGGIHNPLGGKLELRGGTIANNSATGVSGAGGIGNFGELTVNSTAIKGNTTEGPGGGLYNGGVAALVDGSVTENFGSDGGGVFNQGAATFEGMNISQNTSTQYGGGVFNSGSATFRQATIAENFASDRGGGVFVQSEGDANAIEVVISMNIAKNGGGVFNDGVFSLWNGAMLGNTASDSGGGVFNRSGAATVSSSSLLQNAAEIGGGIHNRSRATLALVNSIVTNGESGVAVDSARPVNIPGLTIISDSSLTGPNILNVDPMLDENGVPLPGSPAIDAGDDSLVVDADGNLLEWDVRGEGYRRILGYGVDIGAFESDGFLPGDANGDEVVNLADFNLLKAGFNQPGELSDGEFTGDGAVDLADFNILKSNFGASKAPLAAAALGRTELAVSAAMEAIAASEDEERASPFAL